MHVRASEDASQEASAATFEIPIAVRPFIKAWWEEHGSPESGPVFPVRRGKRLAESRTAKPLFKKTSKQSYAEKLREQLWLAGIRRHELHNETTTTLPVDFHSTRRAYATALARAGVNEQTAMKLTGHSDSKVLQRYLESLEVKALLAAAAPNVDPSAAVTLRRQLKEKGGPKVPGRRRFEVPNSQT